MPGPPPPPAPTSAPMAVRRARLSRRDHLTIGGAVAAALTMGTLAGARVVAADLHEGPTWAAAGALRGINPAAALACIALSVWASVTVLRFRPRPDRWAQGFIAVAVTSVCMLPALLTIDESLDESVLFALPAALVIPAVLLGAPILVAMRWRLARTWLLVGASVVAAWTVAVAAAYVDNTASPVPAPLAAGILLLPLAIGLAARFVPRAIDLVLRMTAVAVHAVGLVFVVGAATSCVDDDCIPIPLWFMTIALATLWVTAAQVIPLRPITNPPDLAADSTVDVSTWARFVDAGGWAAAAPLGFLVLAAALVAVVDPYRSPPAFDAAEPEVIAQLPSMLAWDDRDGCVLIAGLGDMTNFRETCRAEFSEWVEPSPLLVVTENNRNRSVFDPTTFDRLPRSWDFVPNVVEPPRGLRLETLDRGRVEVWVDEADGTSRRLLDARGGNTYGLREGALSPDGSMAAVHDSSSRLLLIRTDESGDPVVLATDVLRFGGWQPTFGPPVTEFDLTARRQLRIPAGVEDDGDFYDAHRELEAALDLTVGADLVVVGDDVHVRLTGTPAEDDFPDGYCVSVTSFFESSPADRTYRSVDVGGSVSFCDASIGQLAAACSSPTVPTAATVDDLERFEVLVIEAQLIAPGSGGVLPGEAPDYQLSTGQVTGGAVNPDDLPRVDDTCS